MVYDCLIKITIIKNDNCNFLIRYEKFRKVLQIKKKVIFIGITRLGI